MVRLIASIWLAAIFIANLPAADRKPNIVFILADDVGYGELGCYGQTKYETPHIDRLAAEGMRFTQHYAASVCAPSRSALMTGLHTGHTPVRSLGGFKTLADEDVTVAEVLKAAGYATGCFGKWGLGYRDGNPGNPNNQGFDEFFGQLHHVHAHFYYPYFLWKNTEQFPLPENEGRRRARYAHDEIHREALEFIRQHRDGPFFAYIAYTIPHYEFTVPEDSLVPYSGRWEDITMPPPQEGYIAPKETYATFAAMMSRLDRSVGEVVALLRELGLDEETLVIFTSDNGPQGNHYQTVSDFFDGNGPFRGYKNTFYEGGIRVPFIARWPGRIKAGSSSDLVSALWDFLPTAAELAGIEAPAVDGISMVPTLLGRDLRFRHEFLYWEYPRNGLTQAVRMGNWKAVKRGSDAPFELYNLTRDPGEATDVAADNPDVLARIRACIAKAARTPPRHYPDQPRPTISDYVR